MPKFKCEYEHGELLDIKIWIRTLEADDHRQAYEKFLKEAGVFGNRVYVGKGFKGEYFSDHIDNFKREEKRKQALLNETEVNGLKQKASDFCRRISSLSDPSYLLLSPNEKVEFENYFNELGDILEVRGLYKKEADFARIWIRLKDRELGRHMLAQAEANKPKSEQGSSPLGKLALAGMAMSSMKLSQDIGAVSDQVENISEGMGFEG